MGKNILIYGDRKSAQTIADIVSQLGLGVEMIDEEQKLLRRLKKSKPALAIIRFKSRAHPFSSKTVSAIRGARMKCLVVSPFSDPETMIRFKDCGAGSYILEPYNVREFIAHVNAILHKKKRITCLGGGTGLFHLLLGLKKIPNAFLTSIVSMGDDGGSSGRLRLAHGILPPGDIRRSLVALSNAPDLMNQVIQYRFKKGNELKGHSFGNLFLTALAEITGAMPSAVRGLGDLLSIQGVVLPVSATLTSLVATFENGTVVQGESKIDLAEGRDPNLHITRFHHEPKAEYNPDAYASIIYSDAVIIGPGDLFTSVVADLAIDGIREALRRTKAKKIYFCNLMTKPGETAHYTAADHVREIIKYLGEDCLDYIFLSNTRISDQAVREYAKKDQEPVRLEGLDQIRKMTKAKLIITDLGDEHELVRHDSEKIKNEIQKLIKGEL